jgi:CBS domain-containing protein
VKTALQRTLADAVAFLRDHDVRYALVGGLAASLRGRPRVTVDVDMVIGCDVPGALELLKLVPGTPFAPLFPDAEEVVERAYILPLRHRVTGVKLDLAVGLSGFEQQVIQRATHEEVAGQLVFVATAEDLLIMKVLAGRGQDEQDAAGIVLAHGETLDWDYCVDVAVRLQEALGVDLAGRVQALRDGV